MSTYKVSYRSRETNRRRSKRIEAPSADAARQLIAPEATDVFSIEFVPPPLASDAQRDYLRAFGDRRWNGATLTKNQAHDLIEEFVAKDAPTNWSFRDSHPATEAQFEKFSKLVTRLLFREYRFEKRKSFILWICLRVRMESRNRSFSRMGNVP
jgi:hypothetical protein